jgi:hypothetical protein
MDGAPVQAGASLGAWPFDVNSLACSMVQVLSCMWRSPSARAARCASIT